MNSWKNLKRNLAQRFLDRCVLRPNRDPIPCENLIRCPIDHPDVAANPHSPDIPRSNVQTEAYVFTTRQDGKLPPLPQPNTTSGTPQEAPQHLAIKFPGTGGRAERSSEAPLNLLYPNLANTTHPPGQHVEVWTWNPPGYGQSTPPARLVDQADFARDFARQVAAASSGPHTQLWLVGNSLGCLSVLHLAANLDAWLPEGFPRNQVGCWLRNPPDLAEVVLRVSRRYHAERFMRRVVQCLPSNLDAVQNASHSPSPAVFLASQKDRLVLPELQARIHQAYRGDKRIVPLEGLDHDGLLEEQHVPLVVSASHWLADQTKPK
ncbi:Alpha/beta hydrolase family protein [Neorhodopirellula lusitana]|uniref:Alpha/beta hydrolase family protein n=1 Tax=Neorhodopirellula lusitana TaxID=445327 RepID=A0ABY1Q5M3_9BACT|nr:alpha/beta fold hydrolase [Neorhodopirellula lusitana]SMP57214.1 Alpha/beta hydrolase family protein [Neorhodopirellula lusitana]